MPTNASVDVSIVRDRFNFEWCMDPDNGFDGDTYWWWARSIRADPNEIIVDDGEGTLYALGFTYDEASDTITFSAPERVREAFVPVAAGVGASASALISKRQQQVLATDLQRPDKPDPQEPNTAAAESAPDERSPMDTPVLQALARQHGLDPESATEDEVNAAVLAAADTEERTPGSEEPNPADLPDPEIPPADIEPAAASVSVRATLGLPETATDEQVAQAAEELRRGAQAGTAVARTMQTRELDAEADAAVADGRIMPSARDAWRAAIDPGENPDAAATARATREREALAATPAGRVPVRERGSTPEAADNGSLNRAMAASGLGRNRRTSAEEEVIHRG